MSFSKDGRKIQFDLGKIFPPGGVDDEALGAGHFASIVGSALHHAFGGTHGAVKTVAGLTGANERAVKNWFDAKNAPSGRHVIALMRHSDEVLEVLLALAGREQLLTAKLLIDSRDKLTEMLNLIDQFLGRAEVDG